MNTRSGLSKRLKVRRKPLSLRNSRSISLRLRYIAFLYVHGSIRLHLGGTIAAVLRYIENRVDNREILMRAVATLAWQIRRAKPWYKHVRDFGITI